MQCTYKSILKELLVPQRWAHGDMKVAGLTTLLQAASPEQSLQATVIACRQHCNMVSVLLSEIGGGGMMPTVPAVDTTRGAGC